jgi:hypothetical protein
MSLEERYTRLEWRLEKTNRIIDEKYWYLTEEMEERHKTRINNYDDYYNGITVMNDRSTLIVLEFNVRER